MRPFVFFFLAEIWAAPTAGVEEHAASVTQLIFPLINFLLYLYLVKRFVLPWVRGHLLSRRKAVIAAVTEADEAKKRAEAVVRDYHGRLAHLDETSAEIREILRREGERERARLLREAEGMAVKIKADASFLAEQEVKLAQQRLREEMARTARAAAEGLIRRHQTSADQNRWAENFLREVGQVR
jgi:F-type H+-transporting ATPase subunit b